QHDDLPIKLANRADRDHEIEIEHEPAGGADQARRVVGEDHALLERPAAARAMGVGAPAVVMEEFFRPTVHVPPQRRGRSALNSRLWRSNMRRPLSFQTFSPHRSVSTQASIMRRALSRFFTSWQARSIHSAKSMTRVTGISPAPDRPVARA